MTSQPAGSKLSVRPTHASEERSRQVSQALLNAVDTLGRQYALHEQMNRAGEAVGQSESCFREMLDALPAAIYTTDAEGRLTHFNPAAIELSGRTPELGTDRWCVSWKLYQPDGTPLPHDKCPMAIALKEGRAVRGETAILERPDGTRIWFMPYPTPLRDGHGQVIGGINMLMDITERMAAEARIQSEAEALAKLNELSSRLWNMRSLQEGLDEMLAATMDLLGADFGNIQILDAKRNVLLIEAQRGFQEEFLDFFREVSAEDGSCCGRALRSGDRIIVEDVETDLNFAPMLHIVRNAGFRAVQSTPLLGRNNRPLGMISTHFRTVHRPSAHDLHLLDLYARQCADFIERCKSDEALRASEERYRQTLTLMPAAVYCCDAAGVISYFNERAAQLWGRKPKIGERDERFCGSDQMILPDGTPLPHEQCPMAVALRDGRSFRDAEVNIRQPNGTIVPVLVNIDPIRDEHGKVIGAINAFHDVSTIKQAEQALREVDRRKDEFLATLAHELRGPLAPVRNMLEIMKRANGNGDVLRQARDTMERQLGQMARLVDDLLDVSRIRRGHIDLKRERVELASVVYQAVEANRPLAECAQHEVTVDFPSNPIYLHGDPVRLAQVFGNLLNNACKYTEPGGKISLTAAREGSDVLVKIKDNGVGIPPERLTSVFEMFSQVESSLERSQGGLGIGLTLVKRLVEMHDGTVTARSEGQGRGSEFVVRLPLLIENTEAEPQPQQEPIPERLVTARRILVVDDSRDAAKSLAMLLKMTGNDTRTAHDGLEAIEQAEAFRPDVILLDIGLPKINGYEACRRIREQPWGRDIVLVALTGWGQEEDRRKSEEAGFNCHLVKPVDYAALTRLLADLPEKCI